MHVKENQEIASQRVVQRVVGPSSGFSCYTFIYTCLELSRGVTRIIRAKGEGVALVSLIAWYKYPSGNVSMYAEARGIWEHAPPGNFFEFDAVRQLLRLFLGSKTSLLILALAWLGNRILIHFTSRRMEISVHWQFQVPLAPETA